MQELYKFTYVSGLAKFAKDEVQKVCGNLELEQLNEDFFIVQQITHSYIETFIYQITR